MTLLIENNEEKHDVHAYGVCYHSNAQIVEYYFLVFYSETGAELFVLNESGKFVRIFRDLNELIDVKEQVKRKYNINTEDDLTSKPIVQLNFAGVFYHFEARGKDTQNDIIDSFNCIQGMYDNLKIRFPKERQMFFNLIANHFTFSQDIDQFYIDNPDIQFEEIMDFMAWLVGWVITHCEYYSADEC